MGTSSVSDEATRCRCAWRNVAFPQKPQDGGTVLIVPVGLRARFDGQRRHGIHRLLNWHCGERKFGAEVMHSARKCYARQPLSLLRRIISTGYSPGAIRSNRVASYEPLRKRPCGSLYPEIKSRSASFAINSAFLGHRFARP